MLASIERFIKRRRFALNLALSQGGVATVLYRATAAGYRIVVRPMLPSVPARYAGLRVPATRRLGDVRFAGFLRPEMGDLPTYEQALIRGLRAVARPGDRVLVVGGGMGVTCTVAAKLVAPNGHVQCIEGGVDQVAAIKKTAALNHAAVEVRHGFVGMSKYVYSSTSGAENVRISDLPDCDILELDCEGAELEILRAMTLSPRAIIVECHGAHGASTEQVAQQLRGRGYKVEHLGVAEPRFAAVCEENDIKVLLATRE